MKDGEGAIYKALIILGFGYLIVIILPYLIFGFSFIPWIISCPDLIDLLIYPLYMGLTLFYIYEKTPKKERPLSVLYIALLIIHIEGHGFHWVANAIDVTIENIQNWESVQQLVTLHRYAYFLDEILSHKIMFYSISIIMIIILYWSNRYKAEINQKQKYLLDTSSIVFGFSLIISFIEGQTPIEGIIFAIALITFALILYRDIREIYDNFTSRFLFTMAMTIVIISAAYFAIFQGFPQPSKWMK
ncbi:MAG: hypothetical protein ACP6IP_02870 [Candidatus Njordarchaeia archaeon]